MPAASESSRLEALVVGRYGGSRPAGRFVLAGIDVVADDWPRWLEPFRRADASPAPAPPSSESAVPRRGRRIHSGLAWLLDAERWVDAWEGADGVGVFVSVPEVASYFAASDRVELLDEVEGPPRGGFAIEVLFGSIVLLALAQREIFAVHASLVATAAGVIGFLGPSGSGKSTVAAAAAAQGWRRLADDVTPIGLAGDAAFARPHFPQLKLADSEQYDANEPSELLLTSLYCLAPRESDAAVSVERLSEREATLALLRQTVVARLFPRPLIAAHLDFCARLAALGGVRTLHFPRRIDALPAMFEAVAQDLGLDPSASG